MIVYLYLYIAVIVIILILCEILAYLWHRYAAHNTVFSIAPILNTHRIHHLQQIWEEDKGDDDYVWVLLILCVALFIFLLFIIVLSYFVVLPGLIKNLILILCITVIFSFWFNWYIHSVIHTDNHWLQQYQIIKDLTAIHRIHHSHPKSNFSVFGFTDIFMDTMKLRH